MVAHIRTNRTRRAAAAKYCRCLSHGTLDGRSSSHFQLYMKLTASTASGNRVSNRISFRRYKLMTTAPGCERLTNDGRKARAAHGHNSKLYRAELICCASYSYLSATFQCVIDRPGAADGVSCVINVGVRDTSTVLIPPVRGNPCPWQVSTANVYRPVATYYHFPMSLSGRSTT